MVHCVSSFVDRISVASSVIESLFTYYSPVVTNKGSMEIENDINEENDIHYGVHNQKSYVTWSCKTGTVNSQIKWHHDHCVEGKA